ncbi:MAG TPA: gamma-glutamylcyclotransferase family protein [Chitinophagaceae bacterium]|nr:gamma-glutamylcyclotransferase family protein [Chitinophagaceae bacterium]
MTYLYDMPGPGVYHVFVYGSLRKGFHSHAYEYISRFFDFVGEAKVKGRLYDIGDYPAATPASDEAFIKGELYFIQDQSEFSWAIGQLDDYEGVNIEEGEEQLYRRELTDVFINDKIISAWIYWYNGEVNGKPVIASGDILEYIQAKK